MNTVTSPTATLSPLALRPRLVIDPILDEALAALPASKTDLATDLQRFRLFIAATERATAAFDTPPCIPDCVSNAYNRMVTSPLELSARRHMTVQEFETVHYADQERCVGLATSLLVRNTAYA